MGAQVPVRLRQDILAQLIISFKASALAGKNVETGSSKLCMRHVMTAIQSQEMGALVFAWLRAITNAQERHQYAPLYAGMGLS